MTQPRILFVDDDEILSGLMQMTLELEGYVVDIAANGEEALAAMRQGEYDVILLDLVMPRIDGIRFLRLLADSGLKAPPVVLVSSAASEELARLHRELLVVGFARKPVEPGKLVQLVEAALAGARSQVLPAALPGAMPVRA
jgi:CheY-like chemotaxis protein